MKIYKLIKKYPGLASNWEKGMTVGIGDGNIAYSPTNVKYSQSFVRKSEVETNPDYWELQELKGTPEVKSDVKTKEDEIKYTLVLGVKVCIEEDSLVGKEYVKEVIRLSDGVVFKLGDRIVSPKGLGKFTIGEFELDGVGGVVAFGNGTSRVNLTRAVHWKAIEFVSEDGVNIRTDDLFWAVQTGEYNGTRSDLNTAPIGKPFLAKAGASNMDLTNTNIKRFSSQVLASAFAKEFNNKVVFKTKDGVGIKVGDTYQVPQIDLSGDLLGACLEFKLTTPTIEFDSNKVHTFSTKEAANEYILNNIKCLSIADVATIYKTANQKSKAFNSSEFCKQAAGLRRLVKKNYCVKH